MFLQKKKQIEHLLNNLKTKVHIFTLDADIPECSKRNKTRMNSLADEDIKQVHNLVSKIKIRITINTPGKSIKQVVSEILTHLSP